MATVRVVPPFDGLEDGEAGLDLGREAPPVEELALEGGEEALAEGVVIGVAHGSHRRPDASLAAPLSEGERGVLAPLWITWVGWR
jgi:hypothetical protein